MFTPDDSHKQKKNDWKHFGMKPEVFAKSALNPVRQHQMCTKDHDHEEFDESENEGYENMVDKLIGNLLGGHDSHGHSRKKLIELLVISENSEWYTCFNIFVTILCLISGYYYGAIAGFRYSDLETNTNFHYNFQLFLEIVFLLHMILQFFVEVRVQGKSESVRNPIEISQIYLKTNFPIDLLTMIPLQIFNLKRKRQYMFYAIKLLRIKKGFRLFDVSKMM